MRPAAPSSFVASTQFAPAAFQAARCYSAASGLQKPEVEGRIVDLLKNFDKVSSSLAVGASMLIIPRRSPTHRKYDKIRILFLLFRN